MRHEGRAVSLRWVLLLTLLVQGLLQSVFFPLSRVGDATPLLYIDSPYHAYQMELARQLCAEGAMQGWDPFFGAGQPAGVVANASGKVQAALACIDGRPGSVWPLYKASSFVLGVLAPAALVVGCMLLGLGLRATALVALLGVLMWWTGGLRWYHTAGLISYVAAAYLVVPFAIGAVQLAIRPRAGLALVLGLVGSAGFFLHPLFPVAAVLLGLPLLLARWPEVTRPVAMVAALLATAGVMLALNMPWVIPTLTEKMAIGSGIAYQAGVSLMLPVLEMLGRAGSAAGGTRLALCLVAGAVLMLLYARGAHRRALVGLLLGSVVLMVWASIGATVPAIARLQPNRFSTLSWLVLVIPAAAGLDAAASRLRELVGWRRAGVVLALAFAGLVTLFFVRETVREFTLPAGSARYGVAPPEVKGEGALTAELTAFLKTHTDTSARVLFENSLGRVHDGAHLAGVLAMRADREFIGGPYPGVDFAAAWDDIAFGQRVAAIPPAELSRLLDAYNVRWMLCHRESCRLAMQALPGVRAVAQFGSVHAFERSASPGWVVEGQARVAARCHNRLELEGISGSRLVLRYHWVAGLRSLEGAELKPIELVPGARPFIAIDNPPPRLTLRRGEGDGLPCGQRESAAL